MAIWKYIWPQATIPSSGLEPHDTPVASQAHDESAYLGLAGGCGYRNICLLGYRYCDAYQLVVVASHQLSATTSCGT